MGFGGDAKAEFKEILDDIDGALNRWRPGSVGDGGREFDISACLAIAETLALTLPCLKEACDEPVSSRMGVDGWDVGIVEKARVWRDVKDTAWWRDILSWRAFPPVAENSSAVRESGRDSGEKEAAEVAGTCIVFTVSEC